MHQVLLTEDNRLNQIVDGGVDAVEAVPCNDFDAVLMDVMMPDMDGYQATAEEIALAAGFNDYLTKPLRENELKDALERWIGPPWSFADVRSAATSGRG